MYTNGHYLVDSTSKIHWMRFEKLRLPETGSCHWLLRLKRWKEASLRFFEVGVLEYAHAVSPEPLLMAHSTQGLLRGRAMVDMIIDYLGGRSTRWAVCVGPACARYSYAEFSTGMTDITGDIP